MKRNGSMAVGLAVAVGLLLYMVVFNVRFDEAALVTTFGRAAEGSVLNADGKGAGWYLKLPWPVQDVRRYDTRFRVLETSPEQQQTRDKQMVNFSHSAASTILRGSASASLSTAR